MELDRQGELAVMLVSDRQRGLRLLEQMQSQYRNLVVHPKEMRTGSLLQKYKNGPKFNTEGSNIGLYLSLPRLLSVDFDYSEDTTLEIRFDDIIKAMESANDTELRVAFDKQVLEDAVAAVIAKDAKRVLNVSMQIQTQVDRYKRAIALAMDERIVVSDPVTKTTIAPEHRTKPITKKKAARLLGRDGDASAAVEWLSDCIREGTIKAEKKTRQSYVFDIREFPKEQHGKLRVSQAK